jgi:hypothetical protein
MTTVALNGLFNYIVSLNLSDRSLDWLSEKLLSIKKKKKAKPLDPEIAKIPEEFRCDPYEISPSGDPFFADKRNVEALDRILNDKEAMEVSGVELKSREDIDRYLSLI